MDCHGWFDFADLESPRLSAEGTHLLWRSAGVVWTAPVPPPSRIFRCTPERAWVGDAPCGPHPCPVATADGDLAWLPDGSTIIALSESGQLTLYPLPSTSWQREVVSHGLWDAAPLSPTPSSTSSPADATRLASAARLGFVAGAHVWLSAPATPARWEPDVATPASATVPEPPTSASADLFRHDLGVATRVLLYRNEDGLPARWEPDVAWRGAQLFTLRESRLARPLMGIHPTTRDLVWVSPPGEFSMHAVAPIDDDELLVVTNLHRIFASVARFHVPSRTARFLFDESWDQRAWLAGNRLLVLDNECGVDVARLYEWPSCRPVASVPPAGGSFGAFAFDAARRRAVATWQSPSRPPELVLLDLADASWRFLTANLPPPAPPVVPCRIRFAGLDGEPLWGWHFVALPAAPSRAPRAPRTDTTEHPPDAGSRTLAPLAIWHREGSQERAVYRPQIQAALARGVSVLAPDPRGVTGYGLPYARAHAAQDLEAAVRWALSEGRASAIVELPAASPSVPRSARDAQ